MPMRSKKTPESKNPSQDAAVFCIVMFLAIGLYVIGNLLGWFKGQQQYDRYRDPAEGYEQYEGR